MLIVHRLDLDLVSKQTEGCRDVCYLRLFRNLCVRTYVYGCVCVWVWGGGCVCVCVCVNIRSNKG